MEDSSDFLCHQKQTDLKYSREQISFAQEFSRGGFTESKRTIEIEKTILSKE
jgi:hypothetical protein